MLYHLVHCRIGSLENEEPTWASRMAVHCRIGSLEIRTQTVRIAICSLPDRQLRNSPVPSLNGTFMFTAG